MQNSLEFLITEKEQMLKAEYQFIENHELNREKVTDLHVVFNIYRNQVLLVDKISNQNKQLKQKYAQLESDYFVLSDKLNEVKTDDPALSTNSGKSREETEPDEDKSAHLKLIIETKEQMIASVTKKLKEGANREEELNERISNLEHDMNTKNLEIRHKVEEIKRLEEDKMEVKSGYTALHLQYEETLKYCEQVKKEMNKKLEEISRLNNELIEAEEELKLSKEEKEIVLRNMNEIGRGEKVQEEQSLIEMEKLKYEIEARNREIEKLNKNLEKVQEKVKENEKHEFELKKLEKEYLLLKENLSIEISKYEQLSKEKQNAEENYEIKLKKVEFNANQERIKCESLKRSLTNIEIKEEESRRQLNEMYEKKVAQDTKMAKMETKIKEYKQLIQYLQKEKVELEKTFETKLKNMDEIVLQDPDEDIAANSESSDPHRAIQEDAGIIEKLHNKIVDLEEQLQYLKEENNALTNKKDILEESNLELEKSCKLMNSKREEVMKQINKMANGEYPSIMSKNKQDESLGMGIRSREKKIAEKALKGFDILSALLVIIYKEFINLHVAELTKMEVKKIEGNINTLLNKCEDMKDIFQGYL